jgi:hypothetical protein
MMNLALPVIQRDHIQRTSTETRVLGTFSGLFELESGFPALRVEEVRRNGPARKALFKIKPLLKYIASILTIEIITRRLFGEEHVF